MLKILNQTDIKLFNKVGDKFPHSRILMRITSLDDCEEQCMAVSDSTESDDDSCKNCVGVCKKDIEECIRVSYI